MHTPAARTLALRATAVIYPGSPAHISAVRADMRALLDGCPMADEVILCVSELAANAAVHSRSQLPGGTITVRAMINPGHHVRIEVEDSGGAWASEVSDATRHHGLDIVRAIANDWGIDGDERSRTSWARFDWPDRP